MSFIYFFISYPRKERVNDEDIDFVVPDNESEKPECIYNDEKYENGCYYYKKIYKVIKNSKSANVKEIDYYYEFEIDDTKYIISFSCTKDIFFIYDVNLEWGKTDIEIRRKINQNKVGYIDKLNNFKEALVNSKETDKIKELYIETVDLYSQKKGFYFLIELFLEIHEQKDVCPKLLKKFRDMNKNPKENEKNMDRKQYLFKNEYIKSFSEILSKAENILSCGEYNRVDFYGIILCYLNYYDENTFESLFNNFLKNNSEELFEILLIFNTHFKNPIVQDTKFFDQFIQYTISRPEDNIDGDINLKKGSVAIKSKKNSLSKKESNTQKGSTFKKDVNLKKDSDFKIALSYILNIETIIEILDNNKDKIYNKYKGDPKYIIVLDKKYKFKKEDENKDTNEEDKKPKGEDVGKKGETNMQLSQNINDGKIETKTKKAKKEKKNAKIDKIIKEISNIIDFSKKKNTFLVHFTNDFWKYVLNYYNDPLLGNIKICSKLRDTFIKYYKLVEKIFDKKNEKGKDSNIKKEAKNYFATDEFAFLIDQIIRKVLKKEELSNIEKLSYITTYNPYYKDSNYTDKAELDIFDLFDLNDIEDDKDFISDFRKMNFEMIFKENISEYLDKIMSKIKTISNFDNIIRLINIQNIEVLGKTDKYLKSLNKRYENIIKDKINKLNGEELNKSIKVVADLVIINYKCEKKEEKKKKVKEKDKVKDKIKGKDKEKKYFDFLEKRIKKLDRKLIPLIYIEIMNICIKEEELKNKEDDENIGEKGDDNENKIDKKEKEDENDVDYIELEKYIFKQFINKLDNDQDIANIISLINCLEKKDSILKEEKENKNERLDEKEYKNERLEEFLKDLITKNLFQKDEYFSKKKNLKIDLFCNLNEKEIIKKSDEPYYDNIIALIQDIRKDLEGEIPKKKLEDFLKNKKEVIKQRLNLIKLILDNFDPEEFYNSLKSKVELINKGIKQLEDIKNNIILYFKDSQADIIQVLKDTIKNSENMKIQYKGGEIERLIKETESLKDTSNQINEVKGFLLFDEIYGMDRGENFQNAYAKLEEIKDYLKTDKATIVELYDKYKQIFDKIREKISNNEKKANKFINKFKTFFQINDEYKIDELTILFKSKKFEKDINSIIFFFNYFEKDNETWNQKLSKEYENISENGFGEIKKKLIKLQKNQIYDYKNIGDYNKLFTRLYNKQEAIEFLFQNKEDNNIDILKNRIEPTDRTISIKDIIDTEECIEQISKMKKIKDNNQIFIYIKSMKENVIAQFENYSKIYLSVIELKRNYLTYKYNEINNKEHHKSENLYDQVNDIIKTEALFTIFQDNEEFKYKEKEGSPYESISFKKLIDLKNKIHIKEDNKKEEGNIKEDAINKEEDGKTEEDPIKMDNNKIIDDNKKEDCPKNNYDDIMNIKRKKLIFFKNTISNLEIIIDYMNDLRNKGSSLPLIITVKIIKEQIEYYLGDNPKNFDEIRKFLSNAKDKYIYQLDTMYKEKANLRILYGKQFRSMMKHLASGVNIDSFLRYILNFTDNIKPIKEGYRAVTRKAKDYIKFFDKYNEESLENISSYITSLFNFNNITPEKHYDNIKIIPENKYKGIYSYECENNTMEKCIINLFWDNIYGLPVAQNVLITNKETSEEEMQAFFHRAILCKYNTLFVVEINDSFSIHQQTIMNNAINNLLTFKNNKFNEQTKQNIDKKNTKDYLDSCIVFIYDKKNSNIPSNIKEFEKFYNPDEINIQYGEGINQISQIVRRNTQSSNISSKPTENKNCNNVLTELNNILVLSSEICGLGKSERIRKMIEDADKKYFHFPLGGIVSKQTIFDKLNNLMKKIKNENYKKIAIHLDLTESKEKSIINEFFFSFLITKFYTNNENIIYIPKDISIYIEIPNCFKSYLSKFSMLTIFKTETITFESMPKFNYPRETINIFERMLGINSNEKMQLWVKKNIGIERYSYHQINIFIKLFISQYNKFKTKLKFIGENNEDVTDKCIEEFANCTKYFTDGGFSRLMTGIEKYKEDLDVLDILSKIYDNDLRNMSFRTPLIFIIKEKMIYDKLNIPNDKSTEYGNTSAFLKRFKEILNLPYKVEDLLSIIEEKNSRYVITNDNFKKMVLIVYRIKANVPVIIMGDTGCGKTALITKLNQIVNNGKKTLEIINIHPGISDEMLCDQMEKKNEIAKKLKDEELWVFFDEMNTCLSMSLLTEIFINRTYNGNKIRDNIRLIGACNPYRKRKGNKEKCGISLKEDDEEELVYLVQPLPQSLLYYVFSFGSIDSEDEKKYIYSIIEKLFKTGEHNLHQKTSDIISQCHIYLRDTFDPSVVSLREIARFLKCVEFFMSYFNKKNQYENINNNNEKNNKLRSIICSIYLCYYIRLTDEKKRDNFENILRPYFLDLVNDGIKNEEISGNLINDIKNKEFYDEILGRPKESITSFSDFLKIEQNYLINQVELDKGIGKNSLLKENLFLLFVSVITNIPLIIIGKPGSGKSLSAQLIIKSMKGKYSSNKFFQLFPEIIHTYFQGSKGTTPDDVLELFSQAEKKLTYYKYNKLELPISMILFDELGLAENSESNPLKILHSKLEYTGKEEGVSFVGISNYSLDAAKINRALVLSVPDLDEKIDEIVETARDIVASISDKLKDDKIFELISHTYFEYKNQLQIIKELVVYKQLIISEYNKLKSEAEKNIINKDNQPDNKSTGYLEIDKNFKKNEKRTLEYIRNLKEFKKLFKKESKIRINFHGNRDFYYIIKGIANELENLGDSDDKVPIIIEYIERNFGGIEYEVDIDLDINLEDMNQKIEFIKMMFTDLNLLDKNKKIKLNSVFMFKELYNIICDRLGPDNNLKIPKDLVNSYNLNDCINSNIRDLKGRYLLLGINPTLAPLITQNIRLQNYSKDISLYEGSSFIGDNNREYRFKKINEIQDDARTDKLIIIENLNQIHPFLFDLYNMNYIIKDEKKFARICFDNFNEQLTEVSDNFRIIILEDKFFINNCDLALLNRLEKMILSFSKLLDKNIKLLANNLIDEIQIESSINNYKDDDINYSLKDLSINCGKDEIQGLIYYLSKGIKQKDEPYNNEKQVKKLNDNEVKEKVVNKLYKILPQDIIFILPDENIIKKKYFSKNIYNLKDYIDYIKLDENKQYKISIIYTYTSIVDYIVGLEEKMSFNISNITSETGFKNKIIEIKNTNENNILKKEDYICIKFDKSNSKTVKFISNYILNNFNDDKYNYHYILIIHINRNFHKDRIERIYSLPDINDNINQIFIDNLNGNKNIDIKDLLSSDIKKFLENQREEIQLDKEFDKTLKSFLSIELKEAGFDEDKIEEYINEILKYMNEEKSIKNKINEIAFKFIDEDKDNEDINCKDIIDKIYTQKYINKYTIDIVSLLIDYIKDNIFNKYLIIIFKKLEDNNILTTLFELYVNEFKSIDKDLIEDMIIKYLDEMTTDKKELRCKFLYNYKIPGFYKFYFEISDYINKNITLNYSKNENNLRKMIKEDIDEIKKFQDTEETLLNTLSQEIKKNYQFIYENISKIHQELVLKDYITFYINKYKESHEFRDDIHNKEEEYYKLVDLLLKLRFNDENKIISNGKKNDILLIKIIWMESNINNIFKILLIFENSKLIFNGEGNKLFKKIEEEANKIIYITREKRNPEHTREVNECFYKLLAGICYSITSDDIKLVEIKDKNKKDEIQIEVSYYYYKLIEINKTLQILNDELYIYLNEMYIIDELIKIIDIFKNNNFKLIKEVRKLMSENLKILQIYANNYDSEDFIDKINNYFNQFYNLLINDKFKKNNDYYDKLRYILFKEFKKINEINYRYQILEKLLEENEMIKKSIEFFQMIFNKYLNLKVDKFKNNIDSIFNQEDDILLKYIETKLDNIFLEEIIFYMFEKNSLVFLNNAFEKEENINIEDEPLLILMECIKFLENYISKPEDMENKLKDLCKLFCLSYIKIYCYIFINMFNNPKPKYKNPKKVIDIIKDNKPICKMMRIYIYKILFNNCNVDVFINSATINKYKLKDYGDLDSNGMIKSEELCNIYKFDGRIKTLKEKNFDSLNNLIVKNIKEDYKKIKIRDFNINENGIDNFYVSSYNSTLSNLLFENQNVDENFYNKICKPLFEKESILEAIKLFYEPKKFYKMKDDLKINAKNIKPLLIGYRFCLNELFNKNNQGIYYPLYTSDYSKYISNRFYPGNDSKINIVYSDIIKHFENKPNEGCYICLCQKWYYHSIPSGFPGENELEMKCPKCSTNIGSYMKDGNIVIVIKMK